MTVCGMVVTGIALRRTPLAMMWRLSCRIPAGMFDTSGALHDDTASFTVSGRRPSAPTSLRRFGAPFSPARLITFRLDSGVPTAAEDDRIARQASVLAIPSVSHFGPQAAAAQRLRLATGHFPGLSPRTGVVVGLGHLR